MTQGFNEIRDSVEAQLTGGRREQTHDLREARTELTNSLALTTSQLRSNLKTSTRKRLQSLDSIRDRVDAKLLAITDQVQLKLDQNIKEGFAQFEKVQQHLKAAEEQLREVGALGHSINDLNNMLKLPHLRGQFGEASLERLLWRIFCPPTCSKCSLPPAMAADAPMLSSSFPIAVCLSTPSFPANKCWPFESNVESEIEEARHEFVRVMKTEARRIKAYIQPEARHH